MSMNTWLDVRLWWIAAWGEADSMPINWNLFNDTSYDINQITWIHNIDVTLQLLSAQKDAYDGEL